MITADIPHTPTRLLPPRDRVLLSAGVAVGGVILLALAHALASGRPLLPTAHDAWLVVHLFAVIPALPLGAFVLLRRKGDRLHRLLGRTWAALMMIAALSSFGLKGLTDGFSWIHILSIVVIVTVPRGIHQAMRHDIAAHRRTMMLVYLGLVIAGAFTFAPGRLLHVWLLG